jgi:hypothetical protein
MSELNGGSYEGTAVEQIPPADSSIEANGSQELAAGNTAGEESRELLTRDEYADHMDHDTAAVDPPEHIEEADLASIDAYDQANGQAREPATRDEYAELTRQDAATGDDAPEHIEEADLDAIDAAYNSVVRQTSDGQHGEAPGGTLAEAHEPEVQATASDRPDMQAKNASDAIPYGDVAEGVRERLAELESENALLHKDVAELRKDMETVKARLERPRDNKADNSSQAESDVTRQRIRELEPSKGQNAKKPPDRTRLSNEAIAVGVAVGGAGLTAAADIMATVAAADTAGIVASALSLAAAAVALSRKRKEAKNADRSQD